MFRINKSGNPPSLLHLCNHVQGHRRLTGGFRAVDFYNSPLRDTAQS